MLRAITALSLALLALPAMANPSYDQLQGILSNTGIPQWQGDIAKIKAVHDKLPDQEFTDTWNTLDAGVGAFSGRAPLAQATDPHSAKELLIYATWLRYQILVNNADGRYSYGYAFDLTRMEDKDGSKGYLLEAATMLFDARMALEIDGARCRNKAGLNHIISGFENQPAMHQMISTIEQLPQKDQNTTRLEAVALEEARGERPLFGWLCGPQTDPAMTDAEWSQWRKERLNQIVRDIAGS